jgi:small GTP-binding protein
VGTRWRALPAVERIVLAERYRSMAHLYYRNAQLGFVVFDLTSRESFEDARSWVAELRREAGKEVVIGLAGNKLDRAETGERQVETSEGVAFAKEEEILYLETSAKTAAGVNELFRAAVARLPASLGPRKRDLFKDREPVHSSGCCS